MEIIIVVLTVALLSGIKICTVPDNKEYLSRSYTLCCKYTKFTNYVLPYSI